MSRRSRRFRRRRWPILLVIAVLVVLIVADRRGWLLIEQPDEMTRYHGRSFVVVRVIDGDTFEFDAADPLQRRPTTRVRLWGVDCPEAARPGRPDGEPWADEATAFVRSEVSGGPVTLLLESHRVRGSYGRVLAHVDTADGALLNELLLLEGLAEADDRWPHHELARYEQAERKARDAGRGIWSR